MKKDIHPKNYREVIFLDNGSGEKFLIHSTVETKETGKWKDGKEYPLFRIEISSASHPFYTGKHTIVDTAGRVQKFKTKSDKSKKAMIEREGILKMRGKREKESKIKKDKKNQENSQKRLKVGK